MWKYVNDETPIPCDVCTSQQMPDKVHSHRIVFFHVNRMQGIRLYQHEDLQTFGCCKEHSLQSLQSHIESPLTYGDYTVLGKGQLSVLPSGNDLYSFGLDYAMHGNSSESGYSHWNMGDSKGLTWYATQQEAINAIEDALNLLDGVPHIDHEPMPFVQVETPEEEAPIEQQQTQEIPVVDVPKRVTKLR